MTILYHFRTQGGGAEGVHIAGIATAFEQLGHQLVFASPTGVDPRRTAGANPFAPKKRGLLARLAAWAPRLVFELLELAYNAVAFRKVGALLQREKCALIYERHAFFLFATALLAARRGVPFIVEVNELAGDERVRDEPWLLPLARWADRITFRRARLIVVVSPHLRRRIAALGIAEEKIVVLPNAVAVESLDLRADGAGVRRVYGLADDALVVGFVGWFVAWHRLEVLLSHLAALASEHPRLRLLLVGDGPLRADLAAQAARLGLADRVIFTGPVAHTTIADHIAAMDIAVVPHSNAYRSPIKLFEYMAQARAIVAPRVEPVEWVLRDGENGVLFDPADPADFRRALAGLLADAPLRTALGAQARKDVGAHHTWAQNAVETLRRAGLGASS